MRYLKQSTAVDVIVGPFVDDTDFKSPETALTISQADCQLSKNAGTFAQKNETTSASHMTGANGHYKVPFNSTDTDTLGRLRLVINESGALPVWDDFMVMPANVWDSLFGSDKLEVDIAQYGGTNGTFAGGRPEVNASHWKGTAIATPATGGVPKVAVEDATSFAQAAADKVWGTTARTLTSLGASLVQEIWDRATSALTTAGSIGKLLVDNINATISSRLASASYTAPDNTSIATILTRVDVATSTRLASASYTTPPTVGDIADQVWDEVLSGHLTAGTTGAALNGAGSAGDPWGTALPGAYGAGTAGNILGNRLDVAVSTRLASASYTAPDNASITTILGRVDVATSTRLASASYTAPDNASIATILTRVDVAVSSRATPAQVNAEVVDAINVDTYAEPSAVPAATASLMTKINWITVFFRNKRITDSGANLDKVRNDADSANIATAGISDSGGVFTKNEWS